MRLTGSQDKTKRKVKTILDGTQERNLIIDYEHGVSVSELRKTYTVTKSYISNIFKLRIIKKRIYTSIIKKWETIDDIVTFKKSVCGVYAICFINKFNHNDIKLYIGNSINIRKRLNDHYTNLKNSSHYSKILSDYFNNEDYSISWFIIEKCSEKLVLQRESYYLNEYNRSCLINTWRPNKEADIRAWLEKAITHDSYTKHYTMNVVTGCKESNSVHKSGYSRMQVLIGESKDKGQIKYFYKHRVAFWEKYAEYPELVRHKCNNPKCYNVDHLESGNHRDNALDKRGDFPGVFEKAWVELKADIVKLTERFSDRWNAGQQCRGNTVSYSVYDWEKKLDLRKKYPEILDSNSDRRFSLSYQKLGRSKKQH